MEVSLGYESDRYGHLRYGCTVHTGQRMIHDDDSGVLCNLTVYIDNLCTYIHQAYVSVELFANKRITNMVEF
jgi:hypothetical protein